MNRQPGFRCSPVRMHVDMMHTRVRTCVNNIMHNPRTWRATEGPDLPFHAGTCCVHLLTCESQWCVCNSRCITAVIDDMPSFNTRLRSHALDHSAVYRTRCEFHVEARWLTPRHAAGRRGAGAAQTRLTGAHEGGIARAWRTLARPISCMPEYCE